MTLTLEKALAVEIEKDAATPRRSPSALSFTELLHGDFPKPTPIIEGLLYEGHVAIVGGAFGQGKTNLFLQASLEMAIGHQLLGREITRPYRVAFIDTENHGGEMKARLERLRERRHFTERELELLNSNWTYEDITVPGELEDINLAYQVDMTRLDAYISRYSPEVLILDCFGKLFRGDEKDEKLIKWFCDGVNGLTRKHASLQKGGIVILHHTTKPDENASRDLIADPRKMLNAIRGNGRLLDFIPDRLGMGEFHGPSGVYYALNGITRSGTTQALLLQRGEDGFYDLHEDRDFVAQVVFGTASRQIELFRLSKATFLGRETFSYSDVAGLPCASGKKWHNNTVADMLKTAAANRLVERLVAGGYRIPADA